MHVESLLTMGSCSSKRITPIAESSTRVGQGESSLKLRSSLRSSSTMICGKSVKWGCITSDEGSTVMMPSRFEKEDCDDSDSDGGSHCHDFDMFCQSQRRLTLSYQTKVEVPNDFQLSSNDISDDLSDVSNGRKYIDRRATV